MNFSDCGTLLSRRQTVGFQLVRDIALIELFSPLDRIIIEGLIHLPWNWMMPSTMIYATGLKPWLIGEELKTCFPPWKVVTQTKISKKLELDTRCILMRCFISSFSSIVSWHLLCPFSPVLASLSLSHLVL